MNAQEQMIDSFYTAFGKRDYATMIRCYHPNVEFNDPVFSLKGKQVGAMWHMLCEAGKDMQMHFGGIQANENEGRVHWEPRYTFSATGRKVHNIIDTQFRFQDGLIIWQKDTFDFWRWSRLALGPSGIFLGWTPIVRNKVRATAAGNLAKFIANHPEYQ